MRSTLLLSVAFLFSFSVFAQNNGRLYGKIVDNKTNRGLEAASVQLFKKSDHSLAGGMLTKPNGDFDIPNISTRDSFFLEVSAIGFASQEITVFFGQTNFEKDLGNIKMVADARLLNTVTVVGQRPALQMGIDRKSFDVSKSLVSTGGTAIDVMRNIPSVTVDVDGNVLLRNNPPQIFVDGRPTILTLEQIPADHIERVELITNPSAKFDAASVGGIINVVLKKDKKFGLNGQVSAGAGSPDILNGNLTLNLRQGQFNFFTSANYNQSGGRTKSETYRINKNKGVVEDYFNQQSANERFRKFVSARFGVDYYLDNRNTLTLTQNFVTGRNRNEERQQQQFLDIDKILDHTGQRTSASRFGFDRSNTQLIYRRTFAETGKSFGADVSYNRGNGDDNTNIANAFFNTDGSEYSPVNRVRNAGTNSNDQVTVQVDFIDPHGENSKIEMGARTYINDFTSQFNSFSQNNGTELKLPLSNNYKYREMVNALYFTYTGKLLGISYQAGLRAEHSKFDGRLVDSNFKFGYQYPNKIDNLFDALFPSLFLTKVISEGQEIQLNYSRRIRRPDFWSLNPFVDINDPFNIRQGNPALKPEFTSNFEFNYNLIIIPAIS